MKVSGYVLDEPILRWSTTGDPTLTKPPERLKGEKKAPAPILLA
jgi:hypothetical protein